MKNIILDSGHGAVDSGAFGTTSDGELLHESIIARQITDKVHHLLTSLGHNILITTAPNEYMTLKNRSKVSNDAGADLFVSIHLNAYNESARGIETYHYPNSVEGARAAQSVQGAMMEVHTTHIDRGVKSANFAVLRRTQAPAILVEVEFIDSMADTVQCDKWQTKTARAITAGIQRYMDNV